MDFIESLREKFESIGIPTDAEYMKGYMKDRFEFFGIKQDVRRNLFKEHMKSEGLPDYNAYRELSNALFTQNEREFHYCSIELSQKYKRHYSIQDLKHFQRMVTCNSWWDTVDTINNMLIHPYFLKYPDSRDSETLRWAKHDNMWLNRIAITCQLKMGLEIDKKILFRNILINIDSDEFFIQKAIGWSLRQMGKFYPDDVLAFVDEHKLKPLSKREAIRLINK